MSCWSRLLCLFVFGCLLSSTAVTKIVLFLFFPFTVFLFLFLSPYPFFFLFFSVSFFFYIVVVFTFNRYIAKAINSFTPLFLVFTVNSLTKPELHEWHRITHSQENGDASRRRWIHGLMKNDTRLNLFKLEKRRGITPRIDAALQVPQQIQ